MSQSKQRPWGLLQGRVLPLLGSGFSLGQEQHRHRHIVTLNDPPRLVPALSQPDELFRSFHKGKSLSSLNSFPPIRITGTSPPKKKYKKCPKKTNYKVFHKG